MRYKGCAGINPGMEKLSRPIECKDTGTRLDKGEGLNILQEQKRREG